MSEQQNFVDNGDGTVLDKKTGLVWAQKDSFQILQDWLTFQEALQFIDDMNKKDYLGFHDWRMPEKEEAEGLHTPETSIKARSNLDIFIASAFSPGGGTGSWSLPFDQQAAFYFSYQSGISQTFDQDFSQGVVRMVRLFPD